ncbi:MAG: PAS domain S-box protein [Betaproteobacteria bacterium]|nr:PAS domain S-box protein [Betaproteobacteria bacterium]
MDLYAHIFENIPDALIVVGPDGRIRMANARVLPLLGYRPEELVGQAIEILVPGEHAPTHAAYRERYMASPHTRRMGATQMR